MDSTPRTATGRWINGIEEGLIALLLGLMTIITFANVIARYVFNSNILWALETTLFLFAWLGLIGASYCVKTTAHLGVDALLNIVSPRLRRLLGFAAVASCLVFSFLLLYGAWQYWLPFATKNIWYEVNDIPMPGFLRFLEDLVNEGETYEKLPRFIPYFAMPLGITLLTFRFLQAAWQIATGKRERLIASHEAEELVHDAATNRREA
ncbi:TRAP transporter small permease [Oceanibacterium hippocampi]|uniref:TRAP transporter small permease protein n=1 Tax=Oceanibacterium hippocampi TaxID=745714 RepID=A0A1Y5TGJ0_9PROT|nr:TRAP transporter small permease [Oceanibacterium hippocampi]SLN61444.1 2,3-diketo-L-gulonate TRAP transporter small permease protein YiaM [Oceanibacterium hippocampi]